MPRPEWLCTGEEELLDETFDLTWSQTNSSSSTSSRESGEVYAYLRIVSIRVVIYRRFASVLERPEHDFHASLRVYQHVVLDGRHPKTHHFSLNRCDSSSLPVGRTMIPSTSPSMQCKRPSRRGRSGNRTHPCSVCRVHRASVSKHLEAFRLQYEFC